MKKPEAWDESAPEFLPDPSAVKPEVSRKEEKKNKSNNSPHPRTGRMIWMENGWRLRFATPNVIRAVGNGSTPRFPTPSTRLVWRCHRLRDFFYHFSSLFQGKWYPRRIKNPAYKVCLVGGCCCPLMVEGDLTI